MEPNQRYGHYRQRYSAGMLPAVVLIAIGAIFFLSNLHLVYFHDMVRFWPAILVALGLVKLVDSGTNEGRAGGGILIAAGAILLAQTLGFLDMRMRDMWPLILIGVGLQLLYQRAWAWPAFAADRASGEGVLHEDAIFSGGKRKITSQDFKGGVINAIFGGMEIDLRKAAIVGDSAVIEIYAVFGGVEIKIPEYWSAVVQGSGIFGGFGDETVQPDPARMPVVKRLIVRGSAVFGGVGVKN